MTWTLSFRGFDRQWRTATVDAATRAEAAEKLAAQGYTYVFSFASRDVRLEASEEEALQQ